MASEISSLKPQAPPQAPAAPANPAAQRLKKACQDFEAIFLRQLLQKMRDTVPKDGLLGNSQAEDIFRSMLDGAVADEAAKSGSLGLGATLYNQLSKVALKEPNGAPPPLKPADPAAEDTSE
jgi:flagellar protein FlgJ